MRRRSVGGAVCAWVDPETPAIRRCARRRRHCACRHTGSDAVGGGVTVASTSP